MTALRDIPDDVRVWKDGANIEVDPVKLALIDDEACDLSRRLRPRLEAAADEWTPHPDWIQPPETRPIVRKLRRQRAAQVAHLQAVEREAQRLWDDYRATAEMIAEIDAQLATLDP